MKPSATNSRRSFLKNVALATPVILSAPNIFVGCATQKTSGKEFSADLVIIGGGLGGIAAALAAARNGLRVIMTEETDWIGGQVTQQAVPPDENRWIETIGCTVTYQQFRHGIRAHYRKHFPLTDKAREDKYFNPGNSWVTRIGGEPRVALAVLNEMLAPHVASGRVKILLNHKAISASVSGDKVKAICVRDLESGKEKVLNAPFFVDATEQGDLLPLTKTEYAVGAEAKSETGEAHAKDVADPGNLQGFTMCFAMEYLPGEDHTIAKPRDYDYWRNFTFSTSAQKNYHVLNFEENASKKIGFDPEARKGFWTYRRILDRENFLPGSYRGDISIVNWPQNDYCFGAICDVGEDEFMKHVTAAKQMSLSLLYWLQTECERPDGGAGWRGLQLRPDILGTADGLAKYPYIREGRRIKAEFTVLEQHLALKQRMAETGLSKDEVRATQFTDSVGIGHYAMDLHITTRGDHAAYGGTLPFQIPLGALIPRRVENLLPACKNLGVTHLTNGCYRLHPIEWNIGEAAGTLAAFCVAQKKMPREVWKKSELTADLQKLLRQDGVRLQWPADLAMK